MMRMLVTGGSGFIGTNLMDALLDKGIEALNLDINPPKKRSHDPYWQECDILNFNLMKGKFESFQPTHVIHLAARTDVLSSDVNDYKVNTDGTVNVLRCIKATPTIERVLITSTQFVFGPPGDPKSDEDYKPVGAYGMSKVLSEKATKAAGLECTWTITRPTNIWGPWHPRYPQEFWLVLKKGLYFHPGGKPANRSYGYVKNIVHQMMMIFDTPEHIVDGKVYYLSDMPIPLIEWVSGFSLAITGKGPRIIPPGLLKLIAATGSLVGKVGIPFPITLSRYASMTEDYSSPAATTIEQFGASPYSLDDGIHETVEWLKLYWNGNLS